MYWKLKWGHERGGKSRMEIIGVESRACTSDRLTVRRPVIMKRLPLVWDKQEGGIMSTVSTQCHDGYNKCFVLWQSPVCVVLKYIPLLLSTIWNNDISPQTVIIMYFNPSLTIYRFLSECRRRNDGQALQTIFFTFSAIQCFKIGAPERACQSVTPQTSSVTFLACLSAEDLPWDETVSEQECTA